MTDAFGNMNDFFDNLATNLHTMENRNLLPNQMRLLGESENLRPKDMVHGHSAAFINSVRNPTPMFRTDPRKSFVAFNRFARFSHRRT